MEPPAKKSRNFLKAVPTAPLVTDGTIGFDESRQPYFSMGEGTCRVPMSMHAANRAKLCAALRKRSEIPKGAVIALQGGEDRSVYDTDTSWSFKQESNFQYLFGVKEPDCQALLRVDDGKAILLVPKMEVEYQKWCGPIKPPAWFQRVYSVDEVMYLTEAKQAADALAAKELLYLQGDANRDSGLQLPLPKLAGIEDSTFPVNKGHCQILWDEINECRLIKSALEQTVLQYANDVSARAHVEVMRMVKAGQREYVSEATFRYQSMLRGCFRTGYDCICPADRRASILHYGHPAEPNSELTPQGSMKLHDMGAEYHGYSADVTVSFPVNGVFTEGQKAVYEAVWAATLAVEMTIKPGVDYKDMHHLSHRVMLKKLKEAGLFVGKVDDMMDAGVMSFFMPHGLGHSLGLDVHDVGGYEPGKFRKDFPSVKENLRLGRKMLENMVFTVEPGFYFVDYLIEALVDDPKVSKFVNMDRLKQIWSEVGGVRIEDDVVCTATGCRVMTVVPRTVAEIEAVMAGQEWPVSSAGCRIYHGTGYDY
eukprot:CAMPEP_0206461032 /NCGR_PEP_ID=MMETSP0324_2-20121206/25101_1 /ASSEMBLY_ACC=CAM_ASM_000836 /TAXON_ID=2866 /ORGANISM="Crypthecodinium cohnii, Strain Seligo" /LENGTH=535 /DNA_ID=CAMNT_0053932839 /DNA_START=103 /DNA_END=1710 /DNA_ORIENTATION=-